MTGLLVISILAAFTFLPALAEKELFSCAENENYQDALTDRSNNIGVSSEGYTDSPYTFEKTYSVSANLWIPDRNLSDGGTVYVNNGRKVWQAEQYWDCKAPFRVTSTSGGRASFDFQSYNDFLLEDDSSVVPYGAFKLDNLDLLYCRVNPINKMNLYGRGNKFVIGENITTESGKLWKFYGGTEHNQDISGNGRPDVVTNIVAASGHWDYIFGGGEGATGTGTQVTVRGNAQVDNLYGGGERKGSVGVDEPLVNGSKGNPDNPGINVYVEDGQVGTLYGGCAINGRDGLSSGSHALEIFEDINVNVSGGHVNRVFAGSDTHDDNGDSSGVQPVDYSVMGDCQIHGDATVNLSAPNVADVVVGDINRNLPRAATNVRQVQGVNRLNITADQELEYMELFDTVNIDGANVKLLNEAGFTAFDSDYSSTEGYIGQLAVTGGGRLELTDRAVINVPYAHYDNTGRWNNNWTEPDTALKATGNHDSYYLRHGWIGEASEADRSDSVIAINGQTAGITEASGTTFNDSSDICGLLIHGSVGGAFGGTHSWNSDVPGYSTLEVLGDPIYSTGDDYYYYIVADGTASNRTGTASTAPTSANGGAAFREPEGADYMVCYRYLEDGKIGWYLREKPEATAGNILAHKGDQGSDSNVTAHIDMNGFRYEWSDTSAQSHVGINVRTVYGSDSVTEDTGYTVTAAQLADISHDDRFSNVRYDSEGFLESFDMIVDDTQADEACWYEITPLFIYDYDDTYEDDVRAGTNTECVRCIYDFVNTGDPEDADYQDSIMTTTPYSQQPKGEDMARLLILIPYECTASTLTVSENDGNFNMTDLDEGSNVQAALHSLSQVSSNYDSVTTQTANTSFAVEIDGSDLLAGITKATLTGTSTYDCAVSSYKNVTRYEISNVLSSITSRDPADGINGHIGEIASEQGLNGLVLSLQLNGITRDGNPVGTGDPQAVNYGELRIMTIPLEDEIVPPLTGLPEQKEDHGMIILLLALGLTMAGGYIFFRRKWSATDGK